MSLLFRIVYAAHANGTHHKLALDGLADLETHGRADWQRLFLKHAESFMDGAKAPDTKFKDFKNHVLHVRDNYWGGALDVAEQWYDRTVDELRAEKWADAVYAAGVLSHYVTDPLMPFHTGQTDAESAIHAAAEWSINRSYNDLRKLGVTRHDIVRPTRPAVDTWLREMVLAGAERSNRYYERLIAHYDIKRGVVDPPSGLDDVSRNLIAGLLVEAAATYAVVLGSALEASGAMPPKVNLTLDTVMAAVRIPIKALAKRLSDADDRAVVEAQYDELIATGTVDKTLRREDAEVRDLHAAEVLAPRQRAQEEARARALAHPARRLSAVLPSSVLPVGPSPNSSKRATTMSTHAADTQAADTKVTAVHLQPSDPVEAAPIIGPKLALRLEIAGIATVADLLATDPAVLAQKLPDSRHNAAEIRRWQDTAAMMMAVPGLRGTHAQYLTGAGFTSAQDVAAVDPNEVTRRVAAFASTSEGKRMSRGGQGPDPEAARRWAELARSAVAAHQAA